jgi:hypothetical protein
MVYYYAPALPIPVCNQDALSTAFPDRYCARVSKETTATGLVPHERIEQAIR